MPAEPRNDTSAVADVTDSGEASVADLGIGYFGLFSTSPSGNRYTLTIVGHESRWVEAMRVPDQTGGTVAHFFLTNVVERFSLPETIITDHGPCLESKSFRYNLEYWGIRTLPYYPKQTEGFNRRVK